MCAFASNEVSPARATRSLPVSKVCCQPCASRGMPSSFSQTASGSSPAAVRRNSLLRAPGSNESSDAATCRPPVSRISSRRLWVLRSTNNSPGSRS